MEVETCPINEAGQRGQLLKVTEVGECVKMEIRDYQQLDVKELQKVDAIQNRDEYLVFKKYYNVGELDCGEKCVPVRMKR